MTTNDMKVKVYFNLHKKLFSVVDCSTGKVVDHRYGLSLNDAEFRVQQGGRQRVLREKRKNVHAYILGDLDLSYAIPECVEVTYNPYKYDSFVSKEDEQPIRKATKVFLKVEGKRGKIFAMR
jgi:hypothetical protein